MDNGVSLGKLGGVPERIGSCPRSYESGCDDYRRRVVVPLVRKAITGGSESTLNPTFLVDGQEVVLHPLELVSIPVERLGEHVGSLASEADRIIAAIDVVISRGWK